MPRITKIADILPPTEFIAIDASTNSMAFAIYKDNTVERYGKIKFSGNNINEKIKDISFKTKALFDELSDDIIIVIEDTIYTNSHNTAAQLAKAQGALLAAAFLAGAKEYHAVSPIAWQSYIGTRLLTTTEKSLIRNQYPKKSAAWYKAKERSIRKHRTIDTVNKKYNFNINDDDVADACGILVYASQNWSKVRGK